MAITESQRRHRHRYIGASDVPAIYGRDDFRTPTDVWIEKTKKLEPAPLNPAIALGNLMEGTLTHSAIERHGLEFVRGSDTQEYRWMHMAMHPDGIAQDETGKPILVESKTTSRYEGWGPPGTDEVPDYVLLQVQAAMHVASMVARFVDHDGEEATIDRCLVTAFIIFPTHAEIRDYWVQRDESVGRSIEKYVERWWKTHVEGGVQPDAPPSVYVAKRIERTENAPPAEIPQDLVRRYYSAKEAAKAANKRSKEAEAMLVLALGESRIGYTEDGTAVRLSTIERKGYTVKPSTYQRLNVYTVRKKQGG